jgi:hypothetical protein
MKYLKMLTVLVAAVAALAAVAAPASATQLTSPAGTVYTSTVHATSGTLSWTLGSSKVECSGSTWAGKVESHGTAVTTKMPLTSLSYTGCNFQYTVLKPGFFEIHTDTAASDGNGTVTWSGAEIAAHTSVGVCVYTTNGTHIGTLTGGSPAKLTMASASIPRTGGNFLCGVSSTLNGTYTINTPGTLLVD